MKYTKFRYLVGDFETTVYKGQAYTEVWASAIVEMGTEDVHIFHSISETFEYISSLNDSLVVYYHNLKFDGTFWLNFLLTDLNMKQACDELSKEPHVIKWIDTPKMKNNTFKYLISDMGQWYSITIRYNNHIIEIRDSLKLLPFSVRQIGKDFKTKHQKLDMEYSGYRYAGCVITDEEKKYIANDVLVVKEALEIMFNKGHQKLTIGSCCLTEYKHIMTRAIYQALFPDLTEFSLDENKYKAKNADEYIRKSYKGGWCYLVPEKANKVFAKGITCDVNSLYPSMMHSESGNKFPVGYPVFWQGNKIPAEALKPDSYYFVRIRTRFSIKENHLPCIQIKGNSHYRSTEWLTTSNVYNPVTGQYLDNYTDSSGATIPAIVELTLTETDFKLIQDHYNLTDFKILDGCYFSSKIGIFDEYIDIYKKQKLESAGALRTIAKLFLNNLYGKFATSTDSSFKYCYIDKDGILQYETIIEFEKKVGYIPIGSAITSYARNFTIRAAQTNYHGIDKSGFIYADTDSIHCDLTSNEIKGAPRHDKNFCCWKYEATWDNAIFVRQKTYIEHVIEDNLEPLDKPYYNIKCAGMPENSKHLFYLSMIGKTSETEEEINNLPDEWKEFVNVKRDLTDFKIGLRVPAKLMPKRIRGGTLLVETSYEMR